MLLRTYGTDRYLSTGMIDLSEPPPSGRDTPNVPPIIQIAESPETLKGVDLDKATIDVRNVTVQQVHVNGVPVGSAVRIRR